MRRSLGLALVLALAGCSDEPSTAPSHPVVPPPDAGGCGPGETTAADGSCVPAGIPVDGCASGFEPTGDGSCDPVMPPDTCPDGRIAVPGDTRCRPVAPCEDGRWGGIPVEPDTVYVDAGWTGPSDGSEQQPFRTLQEGVDAAGDGAVVAVAEGTYDEDVLVMSRVRIWGRCPDLVELVGVGSAVAALRLYNGSDQSEVHRIAIRGPETGVIAVGVEDVVLDQLWVHHTAERGIDVEHGLGGARMLVKDTLIEHAAVLGAYASGTELTIESCAIRYTEPVGGEFGRAVELERDPDVLERGRATVIGSALQHNHEISLYNSGSDMRVEGSWVQDTRSSPPLDRGWGIAAQVTEDGERPTLEVIGSVIDDSLQTGVYVSGGDLLVERTAVRSISPTSVDFGARGVSTELEVKTGEKGSLVVRSSLVERCRGAGLIALGADATVEATRVRESLPLDDTGVGRGVQAQALGADAALITLRSSVVERSGDVGVFAVDSTVIADHLLVDETLGLKEGFGDGLVAMSVEQTAHIELSHSAVKRSSLAGVANFGGSVVIDNTQLECNSIHLDGEIFLSGDFEFEDGGGNACGCDGETASCQVQTSSLVPPEPL